MEPIFYRADTETGVTVHMLQNGMTAHRITLDGEAYDVQDLGVIKDVYKDGALFARLEVQWVPVLSERFNDGYQRIKAFLPGHHHQLGDTREYATFAEAIAAVKAAS